MLLRLLPLVLVLSQAPDAGAALDVLPEQSDPRSLPADSRCTDPEADPALDTHAYRVGGYQAKVVAKVPRTQREDTNLTDSWHLRLESRGCAGSVVTVDLLKPRSANDVALFRARLESIQLKDDNGPLVPPALQAMDALMKRPEFASAWAAASAERKGPLVVCTTRVEGACVVDIRVERRPNGLQLRYVDRR